ncbi:F0F1 ATP synthase subunit B [Paenibacillus yanchengensis]|uniref:ATP synthase subunit b n=1 Tax=Paenibacillus yanchengensis TaxID=2035833 RepID=A0ABW4YN07_9BACL
MSINWLDIVITLLAFAVLYYFLNKFAFGKLFGIMEKRRELIASQLNEARETREQAAQYVEDQKQELENARKEAYGILEQARVTSSKQSDEMIKSAQAEATRIKTDSIKDIEAEKSKAVAAIRSEVGGLSVQIASKILEKQVDGKSQEQLVKQYMKEVESK